MTYKKAIDFLYSQLPMYQRVGKVAFKKGLGNTHALLTALNDPHTLYPCIHVAGTNGKGTVSHMIAACLTAAGFSTGLYISPHYKDFRERIKINGRMIPQQDVVRFVSVMQPVIELVRPSFFEMTVALAFDAFARHRVDVAVIETGLGGRLDSTNVITPKLSVITNISFDHMSMLGNTLEKIAKEKAGIIKEEIPVIVGEFQPKVASVFKATAKRKKAPLSFANKKLHAELIAESLETQTYTIKNAQGEMRWKKLRIGCAGPFQSQNLITALHALDTLGRYHEELLIKDRHIRKGMLELRKLAGYQGRWQVLGKNPLILADSAHNPGGLSLVLEHLQQLPHEQLHFVIGFVNDKDLDSVLSLFPSNAQYYFCKPDIPRGLDANELMTIAEMYGLQGKSYASVKRALNAAKKAAGKNDLIYVGGSTFVVAEVL